MSISVIFLFIICAFSSPISYAVSLDGVLSIEWQEKEEAKKLEESLEAEKLEGIKEEEDLMKRSLAEMRLKVLKNKY